MLKTRMSVFCSVMQAGALRQEIGLFAEFTTRVNRYFVISVRASFLSLMFRPSFNDAYTSTYIRRREEASRKKRRIDRSVYRRWRKKYGTNEISRRK